MNSQYQETEVAIVIVNDGTRNKNFHWRVVSSERFFLDFSVNARRARK